MTSVGLGWLRGTLRVDHETVLDALRPYFGQPSERPYGVRWYRTAATLADRTAIVAWDGYGGASGTTLVDLTQTALDHLGWEMSLSLAATLRELGFQPSRLDVYMDDRLGLADPANVREALEAGQVVTHAQGHSWQGNSAGGLTTYVGARQSERFLRVYRTLPVHGYDGTRWELETKGEAAAALLESLTVATDSPAAVVSQALVSYVDFRDRVGVQHGERAPRLDWWTALVGSLARVKGVGQRRIDSMARRAAWVRAQVAPSLAALVGSLDYGNVWLTEVIHDGRRRSEQWAIGT